MGRLGPGILVFVLLVACAACVAPGDFDRFRTGGEGGGIDGGADAGPPVACDDPSDCDDGESCNGVEECRREVCVAGTPMDCADGDPCTMDLCSMGSCRNPPAENGASCGGGEMRCCGGSCVDTASSTATCGASCAPCGSNSTCTGGRCECLPDFGDCDGEPGCEASLTSDRNHCGRCDMPCGAGLSCVMSECRACSTAADCNDGLSCTSDVCPPGGGVCMNPVSAGSCLIAGACRTTGERNPAQQCEECAPASSTSAWSPRSGSCEDGRICTTGDSCSAATCSGTVMPCNDSLSCTLDSCSDALGGCQNPLIMGNCLIAGVCYANGTLNPANACQQCNVAAPFVWSGVAAGTPCNDGVGTTCDDQCNGAGSCAGTRPSCDDLDPCTQDNISCGAPGNCDHPPGNDGADCPGPARGHCCNGVCRDFGNCCGMGGCGFGGQCAAACRSFNCCCCCGGTCGGDCSSCDNPTGCLSCSA